MTTYYLDPVNGSNLNNGRGPDASHASNKPFATIGKLIAASGVMSPTGGDVAYLAPGVYRERVVMGITSPNAENQIIGDPTNSKGFKTSGGSLVAPAPVVWTGFETNDTSLPSAAAAVLDLAGRDWFTFQNIDFIGGRSNDPCCVGSSSNTPTNLNFNDCSFFGSGHSSFTTSSGLIVLSAAKNVANVIRFNRCLFAGSHGTAIKFTPSTPDTADFDVDIQITNCIFVGGFARSIYFVPAASGAFKPGGLIVNACTFIGGGGTAAVATAANTSTSIPVQVNNCLVATPVGLVANAAGQMTAEYCSILASTPTTNVTPSNSTTDGTRPFAMHLGQMLGRGFLPVTPFAPYLSGSGWAGQITGTSPPSTDYLNRVRPAGTQSTSLCYGAMEWHNTAKLESSTTDAGNAIKITGPGDHDIYIPVDSESTTISIKCRYDTTHGTTNKPQVILLANGGIGVSTQTVTASVGVDTWETLTLSSFTPTAKGVVTLRLVSRSAGGSGVVHFDTVSQT